MPWRPDAAGPAALREVGHGVLRRRRRLVLLVRRLRRPRQAHVRARHVTQARTAGHADRDGQGLAGRGPRRWTTSTNARSRRGWNRPRPSPASGSGEPGLDRPAERDRYPCHRSRRVDVGAATIQVPVGIVHGSRPGPRVAVTAGVHGADTFPSPRCARSSSISTLDRDGSLVAVLTANPAASPHATIYVDPLDGLNLNRQFPGDPAGTSCQRLAHWLMTEVIAGSDVFVDMHCGDMNEALVSFTGIEETGDASVDARSRALAEAYGLRYLLIGPSPGTTTTAAAALGIPAVLAEVGGQGRWPGGRGAPRRRLATRLHAAGLIQTAPEEPAHRTEVLPPRPGCARRRAAIGTRPSRWVTGSRPAPWWARSRTPSARSSSGRRRDGWRGHLPGDVARDERRRSAARAWRADGRTALPSVRC